MQGDYDARALSSRVCLQTVVCKQLFARIPKGMFANSFSRTVREFANKFANSVRDVRDYDYCTFMGLKK